MNLRMNDDTTSEPDDATITELFASDDVEDDLVLQFPSPDFPAPPAFRLRVPASWRAVPVPEAEMAAPRSGRRRRLPCQRGRPRPSHRRE